MSLKISEKVHPECGFAMRVSIGVLTLLFFFLSYKKSNLFVKKHPKISDVINGQSLCFDQYFIYDDNFEEILKKFNMPS